MTQQMTESTAAVDGAFARGPITNGRGSPEALVESYRRVAEVFHEVMSEQSRDALLDRIAETLSELVPYEALHIYEADDQRQQLVPVLARSQEYEEEIMSARPTYGAGLTGWAVSNRTPVWTNRADLDPRTHVIPGTPNEPEALIVVPLVARGAVKGALNIYRLGQEAQFEQHEFELAKWFGDAAALALDNAHIRARLEHLAQTDSLTGLYNHRYFHERLRAELTRASRSHDSVAVLMFDLDDFKRVNDVWGHAQGDELLERVGRVASENVRGSDVVCRIGGEEFGVIMPSCDASDAMGLAQRLVERIRSTLFEPAGRVTVSIGVAQGPRDAMNPRELVACAEVAMMTAKAHGKNRIVTFGDVEPERPNPGAAARDARSISHLKLLQSLAGKLNRLTDVRQIGEAVATELRQLIDYHNCRVVLRRGDALIPVAFVGTHEADGGSAAEAYTAKVGQGVTGRAVETGESLLIPNALECDFAYRIPGTADIEESLAVVPLRYGPRVTGAIVISKLGLDQFDSDDIRLLEVLAGHASVALENAHLYQHQRREAEGAKALLAFTAELREASSVDEICTLTVTTTAALFATHAASLWLGDTCVASYGDLIAEGPSAPLAGRGRLVVPQLDDERDEALLVGVAHQAIQAIESIEQLDSLERTFVSTVEALANALEASDEYTSSHARWITDVALLVGRELDLDREAMKRLELGALFHDIGKIGIPSEILRKEGPLTDEEFELVKEHPVLGARILAPIDRLTDVRPIVRAAHERWDGRGYPDGVGGDDIPLEARIVFVCDAFHAMTTDRPYRDRLQHDEALRRLRAGAGSQFDPTVVETFARLYELGDVELVG
jgi:diguanylate cyclase (GGDEF)-like protein